jgi:hypothetical protein
MPQAVSSPPGENRKSLLNCLPRLLRFPQVFNLPALARSFDALSDWVKVR